MEFDRVVIWSKSPFYTYIICKLCATPAGGNGRSISSMSTYVYQLVNMKLLVHNYSRKWRSKNLHMTNFKAIKSEEIGGSTRIKSIYAVAFFYLTRIYDLILHFLSALSTTLEIPTLSWSDGCSGDQSLNEDRLVLFFGLKKRENFADVYIRL